MRNVGENPGGGPSNGSKSGSAVAPHDNEEYGGVPTTLLGTLEGGVGFYRVLEGLLVPKYGKRVSLGARSGFVN